MAMIYCPECRNVNSQFANICPKCGFPVKEFLHQHALEDLEKFSICPKCADYYRGSKYETSVFEPMCRFCHIPLVPTDIDVDEFNKDYYKNSRTPEFKYKLFDIAKKYGNNQFSEDAYKNKCAEIDRRANEYLQKQKSKDLNIPKCPTCGSTNIRKIGTGERAMSVIGFGILSKKLNKTWQCNNCSHTW